MERKKIPFSWESFFIVGEIFNLCAVNIGEN